MYNRCVYKRWEEIQLLFLISRNFLKASFIPNLYLKDNTFLLYENFLFPLGNYNLPNPIIHLMLFPAGVLKIIK